MNIVIKITDNSMVRLYKTIKCFRTSSNATYFIIFIGSSERNLSQDNNYLTRTQLLGVSFL